MSSKVAAVLIGLVVSIASSGADAAELAASLSLRATPLSFVDRPPPAPRAPGPSPRPEDEEYARRSWEAFPLVALGAPFCRGDALGSSRCADAGTGTSLGGGALYRLTPHVAIGVGATFTSFGASQAHAGFHRARWMGLLVRGYFLDRGAFDPYVEAGIGAGTVDSGDSDGPSPVHSRGAGPATSAAVGLDYWVLPYLRIGPALTYRWTWLTRVEHCTVASCTTDDVGITGAVGSHLSLGLVATFAFGGEM